MLQAPGLTPHAASVRGIKAVPVCMHTRARTHVHAHTHAHDFMLTARGVSEPA